MIHLSGKPDLVFVRRKAVLFVHGCYWTAKFAANTQRDRKHIDTLLQDGWRVGIVWECRIGKKVDPDILDEIEAFLNGQNTTAEWG